MQGTMGVDEKNGKYHMMLKRTISLQDQEKYGILRMTNAYLPFTDVQQLREKAIGSMSRGEFSLQLSAENAHNPGMIVYSELIFRDMQLMEFFVLQMMRELLAEERWEMIGLLKEYITYRLN